MNDDILTRLARAGYAARGLIYLLVGGLALMVPLTDGGEITGSRGALDTLTSEVWGLVILWMIGIGLFGYALWRVIQATYDPDHFGSDAKGLAIRGAMVASAAFHVLLAVFALSLALAGASDSSSTHSESQRMAAWLLRQPFGPILLGIVGLGILVAGIAQINEGLTGKYRERLAMPGNRLSTLSPICVFGIVARGIVFVIIGIFVAYAALTVDPQEAGGVSAALNWLSQQSYGVTLFVVMAAGLVAFGVYSLIEAVWRRIDTSGAKETASNFGSE